VDWSLAAIIGILGIVIAVIGIAVTVIGPGRIRRWIGPGEPEPYYVPGTQERVLENDPIVGPIWKAEQEAGNPTSWVLTHQAPAKEGQGYEYLRANRRKIVCRSKTFAHGDEVALMVCRQQRTVLDGQEVER